MPKIDENIIERIKQTANVADVLRDRGVSLFRSGTEWVGLCPFHDDTHLGSFKVNERKGFYHCFSCGAHGNAIDVLMKLDGLDYQGALRYLAAMYGIVIDDGPVPQVPKRVPRPLPEPTKRIMWTADLIKEPAKHYQENNLVQWMLGLHWKPEHRANLELMLRFYQVGTSQGGSTQGWTVFPLIDPFFYVRDAKFMKYQPDGHRDKTSKYNTNWLSSRLSKAGKWDENKYHVERCLFGLHFMKMFEHAEVCIVESEKSAVLCSAFTDPNERIWMATGGKKGLNPVKLKPLLEAGRHVVLYPDLDGYEEWQVACSAIDSPLVTVSQMVKKLHIAADGPKADIADIMVRKMSGIEESEYDKVCRRLGVENNEALLDMMNKLELKLQ